MSLFTTEKQTSAYYKDPDYYRGSGFILGLMGYKKNGQKNLFGKIKDVALPVIGGIAGTLVGGPAGTAIGSALGQGLNAASNAAASGIVGGSEDSKEAIDADLAGTLARGNLGMSLSNIAGGVATGAASGQSIGKIIGGLGTTLQKDLPAIGSGLAGAVAANGTTVMPMPKRVRYFRSGGETANNRVPAFLQNIISNLTRLPSGIDHNYSFTGESRLDQAGVQVPLDKPYYEEGDIPALRGDGTFGKFRMKYDSAPATLAGFDSSSTPMTAPVVAPVAAPVFSMPSVSTVPQTNTELNLDYIKRIHSMRIRDAKRVMGRKNVFRSLNDTFKNGGETKPFSYTYAGMKFTITPPTDYTVYAKKDKTEDIEMADGKTGEHYGAMRYGERILSQHSNLAIKAIMRSGISAGKKQAALGELLHEEVQNHSDMKPVAEETDFQQGGPTRPRSYSGTGGSTSVSDGYSRGRLRARAKADSTDNADQQQELAALQSQAASTTNPAAKARLQARIARLKASFPAAPAVKPAAVQTPVVAPPKIAANSVTPVKPSVPNTVRRGKVATKKTGPAKVSAPVVKPITALVTPIKGSSDEEFRQAFTALSTAKPKDPIGDTLMSRVPGLNASLAQQQAANQPVVPQAKPANNLAGNLLDLGRIATGAIIASKKTPQFSVPARFTNWQAQVEAKKDQGYTAPEWNTINGQIADTYSAGVNSLTNSLGSGATPGVVLAGLTRLNQSRGQQNQAAVTGDVARRASNFGAYGAMVNQDYGIERDAYDAKLQSVNMDKQAGAGLVQSALANMESRNLYNDSYGPNSLYQKLMKSQVDRDTEATDTLRLLKKANISGSKAVATVG